MRHHLSILPIIGLLLCLGGPAAAQDYEAAGRHFAAAQDAFAQGQYQKAAESFKAAFDITRDPVLLFNIGESWQRAGDAARAVASYRAYLSAAPTATDRPEVERRMKELEGAAPTPPPAAAVAKAAASQNPAVTPPEERRQVAAASRYRTAAWATMAGAMAIVTAGAVLGLGAQNRADEISRRTTLVTSGQPLEYTAAERDAYTALMSEGQAYNQGAITCLVIAGAAAVSSGVLFLIDWKRGRRPEAPKAALPSLRPEGEAPQPLRGLGALGRRSAGLRPAGRATIAGLAWGF